jgi:Asp/Glu/hydantoin racemase
VVAPAASVLIINPNTSCRISRAIGAAAARWARPQDRLHVLTAAAGNDYIGTDEAMAVARDSAITTAAQYLHGGNAAVDALVIGCFADIALTDLRSRYRVRCMSLLGASLLRVRGRRFSIVTAGAQWRAMLPDMVRRHGDGSHFDDLCTIRTFEASIDDVVLRPDAMRACLQDMIDACLSDDGAEVVIVGGAALAGMASGTDDAVVDCVEAAVRWAIHGTPPRGSSE